MVGYEPGLNPDPEEARRSFTKFLEDLELDCDDNMSTSTVEPHVVDDVIKSRPLLHPRDIDDDDDDEASLSRPLVRPCYGLHDDVSLSSPVLQPCNTCDNNASSSSRIIQPDHIGWISENGYDGRLTTPLIQVFSVCISTYFNDGEQCEINGSIRVLEGSCPRFYLYNRDPKSSEAFLKDGALSLIDPDDKFFIPSLSTALELCLYDQLRGVEVIVGNLSLNTDSYNRLQKGEVVGANGVAVVYYAVFELAVNGSVDVSVTKITDDGSDKNCGAAEIYGSIVAGYKNGKEYCSADMDVKQLKTRLFDTPKHQPLSVVAGRPIPLCRNAVAAPAYSTLKVEMNLLDSNGKFADGCLQFPADGSGENPKYIRTQRACVRVSVRWEQAILYFFYRQRMTSRNKPESILKTGKELSGDRHQQPPILPREVDPLYYGSHKVDVLSVFVSGIAGKITALCGDIIVDDSGYYFTIYKRDDNCAELLSDTSLLSVDVNYRPIRSLTFGLLLHLRDPIGKFEVSRGSIAWNSCSIGCVLRQNKRLCSVVRGDDGYAVVHYQMFSSAFEAWVEVNLISDDNDDRPINLHGTLFGSCSGEDYSTSYQKKYYMSRLFDQPRDRSVNLKPGSKIALLKSIVIVPEKSSLIIEANLGAIGTDGYDEPICGTKEFKIDMYNTISKRIRIGDRCGIEITVKYKR